MNRFFTEYYDDYPVYHPESSLAGFYRTLSRHMYRDLWENNDFDSLPFASAYSYIMGLMNIAKKYPGRSSALELYHQCFTAVNLIRGVPSSEVEKVWNIVAEYIRKIPVAEADAILAQSISPRG